MMIMADVEDCFAPMEESLLVDPIESKSLIEGLLDTLPRMFQGSGSSEAVLGSAIQCAFDALKKCGGKLSVFQTNLPMAGIGKLQNRDDPKIMGTDKEKQLFEPQEYFWSKMGQQCAVHGVSVDMYLFPNGYIDVATIGALSALTGGDIHMYSSFHTNKDGVKFANDLQRTLARTFGYDGLLRVRISNNLTIKDYYGNFYMKNATDVELAGIDSLKSFACSVAHTGKLDERQDCFVQAALLYTTSDGHRRVRVHNLSLGVASQLSMVFRHASMETTNCLLSRQMIQKSMTKPLNTIRSELSSLCSKILLSYRSNCATGSSPGQLILPESFKLFPLYALSMLKTRAFRSGRVGSSDLRVYSMRLINSIGVSELSTYLYPSFYDVTDMVDGVGETQPDNVVKLFPIIRASAIRIQPSRVYVAENGRHLFLFVGKDVPSQVIQGIFGVDSIQSIQLGTELPVVNHPHNAQLHKFIQYIRVLRPRFLHLSMCRQGLDTPTEIRFANLLIEDANFDNSSYIDYLCTIHRYEFIT
jgi:protein transport protein SEC24